MAEHLNETAAAPSRVVVIGAGGFVGGTIADAAEERGWAATMPTCWPRVRTARSPRT